ncbi:MAG: hypothetical protein HY934_10465 [Candidatus Firestonebacteria bacterium]|nr:hypothetical protein [Candidatus Firestonebacteria bacterium]
MFYGRMYFENPILTRNGEERLIAWHSTLLMDDKKNIIGYLNSGIDITEQKKAQEIIKRDKDKIEKLVKEKSEELIKIQKELANAKRLSDIGTLVSSVAHELRNPLTVIMGAAYNIKKKCTDESIDEHIAKIEKKVIESDHIINNLLGYTHLKPPKFENVKLSEILEDSIDTTRQTLNNPKISINLDIDPIKDVPLRGDPVQIGEVFNNLLINAGQAINKEKGGIIMKAFVCKVCGFVSLKGDAPERCPVCGSPKSAFELKEDAIITPKDPNNLTDYEKKHIPLIKTSKVCSLVKECFDVNAIVGEIVHPMDADHFIHHLDFYIDNEFISRVILSPGKVNPGAGLHLKINIGKISVIEFCTKHGRWIGESNL